MEHTYDKTFRFDDWTVKIDTKTRYGFFEHETWGEGGGLWFERVAFGKLELVDYDGVAVLPKTIVSGLRVAGYILGREYD